MSDKQKVLAVLALIGPGYPKTKVEAAQYLGWSVYEVVCAMSKLGA